MQRIKKKLKTKIITLYTLCIRDVELSKISKQIPKFTIQDPPIYKSSLIRYLQLDNLNRSYYFIFDRLSDEQIIYNIINTVMYESLFSYHNHTKIIILVQCKFVSLYTLLLSNICHK